MQNKMIKKSAIWNNRHVKLLIFPVIVASLFDLGLSNIAFSFYLGLDNSSNSSNNTIIADYRIDKQNITERVNASDNTKNGSNLVNTNMNPEDNPNCYYYGLFVCNEFGKCDDDRFDCVTECNDGIERTTGTCPGDDEKICWINDKYICDVNNSTTRNNASLMNDNMTGTKNIR